MKPILEEGHNCWSIEETWKTGLLIDARNYFRALHMAAKEAKRFILMAGWQFDSHEPLLRGEDAEGGEEVRFLSFLDGLCRGNPELRIYLLAWDYSPVFVLSREWLQEWMVNWKTNERLQFRFDNQHAIGGSHHQKFVVIDGWLAFVGGIDLCSNRWDDRDHQATHDLRKNANDKPYHPFHDIQSYSYGPVAERLTDYFKLRWKDAVNEELDLPIPAIHDSNMDFSEAMEIPASRVAISRTHAATLAQPDIAVREIRQLYMDAIESAEKLIYIENQYLSSQRIYQTLLDHMTARRGHPLQIIVIMPDEHTSFFEEVTMGIIQSEIMQKLHETAEQMGHHFGIYYSVAGMDGEKEVTTYVHAKLFLVDDRFLSIGSANVSNRSMGLDTELNVSWEATSPDQEALIRSIRKIRQSLLAEHTGVEDEESLANFEKIDGLVQFLDGLAKAKSCRLRQHPGETSFDKNPVLKAIKPEGLDLDPSKPIIEETLYETLTPGKNSLFAGGIALLQEWMSSAEQRTKETKGDEAPSTVGRMRSSLQKGIRGHAEKEAARFPSRKRENKSLLSGPFPWVKLGFVLLGLIILVALVLFW